MPTDERKSGRQAMQPVPGSHRTPRRKKPKTVSQPQTAIIHATPAEPGSDMVLIPVHVRPKGTQRSTESDKSAAGRTDPVPRAARRASKKANRLRRKARRYDAKAKFIKKQARTAAETPPRNNARPRPTDRVRDRRGWLPRPVKNALISSGILVLVLVTGGVAYTWWNGRKTPDLAANQPASAVLGSTESAIKPSTPAASAPESAAVEMLSSPVNIGGQAVMSIRTQPGSNCTIKAVYNNVDSTDPGLAPGVADEFGTLSWSWKIGENVPTGTWPVTVTCLYHGRSAVVQGDLVVIPKGHVS